ncbi:transglutaminaseTgpA domain-containing protein [Shewanella maritima]|uniref:transglutaminase family protein n=1 Tax=Shewanella maritima TaxID=2520507 RepID=UPI0037353A3F
MQDNFDSIISRNTLFWLLVTNATILFPLYSNATIWSIGICAICFVWRVGIYYGKVSAPPKLLVTTLALASAGTLSLVASQIGTLNALVNLLLLGYALKYIEMRQQRDVKVVVLVGYFLIAFAMLDNQSMLNTGGLLIVTAINTCVLISVYQDQAKRKANFSFAAKLVLQSLPLAILLFVVFPRLGPLWLSPNMRTAQTGLSNELSFGDISQLTRSDKLAFRVSFEADSAIRTLPNEALYWRTLVMEDYDGSTWRQHPSILQLQQRAFRQKPRRDLPSDSEPKWSYTIISEASHKKWMYGLDQAFSQESYIYELPDFRLFSIRPIDQRLSYRVQSYPNSVLDTQLSPEIRKINLSLPEDINPESRALAEQFVRSHPKPLDRAYAMMNYFTEQPFFYTLKPPRLGSEQIDDFLFENRAGFCAHYASAFVFLARQSGIPARLVSGYQGGEYNAKANYYSVYQYMAHAWTELWIEGKGWQRFDPTAMIAPERILDGFDATFDSQSSYLEFNNFSPLRMKQYPWLNEIHQQIASLDFYWSVWVLGFDEGRKQQLLEDILGNTNTTRIIIFMLVSLSLIGLMIAYYAGVFTRHSTPDVLVKYYNRICQRIAKIGVKRDKGQTTADFTHTVTQALQVSHPELVRQFTDFSNTFEALKYQPMTELERKQRLTHYRRLYLRLRFQSI